MATVAAVIASTHHPFYYRASTSTGDERPPFADEWQAKIETFRETLTRAEPDLLVMVGSDHFHQLWLDNMPQFLVGKAPFYDANFYNEEREFGLPRFRLEGDEELSQHILRGGLDRDFDLAFSNELRIDHSITCPIITLRPEHDLPIVPIYTNIFAPPLPQPKRFVELGRTIRQLVESWPDDRRVAIIGTGHLSLELGGPRQFGPHGPDPDFDLAFSNELRIDHSITCPIITLRPEADLPIVPIYTNIFAPPLPQPKRFVELGRAIRELVESWPSDQRVAIIGTGHLSLELGGPRQFGPHGPDPEFDQRAVQWIANGDLDGCLREVSLDSLHLPGNATHGFMDFMLMMGVAGDGVAADHVDSLDLFHTMEAYFTWYPNGAPA